MAALRALKTFRVRELAALTSDVQKIQTVAKLPNPFISYKNAATGRWAPPKYSLRQQAELIKSAKSLNLLHLLPIGPKSSLEHQRLATESLVTEATDGLEWWKQNIAWQSAQKDEKGTRKSTVKKQTRKRGPSLLVKPIHGLAALKLYAGRERMFKGHKWERVKAQKDRKIRLLMRGMTRRIARYRTWYKRRRPNPLKPTLGSKAPSLPF